MAFENCIKGFIIPSNLKGFSNCYRWHQLCKYKTNKNILKINIIIINIMKIRNYIMCNNIMQTDFMKVITILRSDFYLCQQYYYIMKIL